MHCWMSWRGSQYRCDTLATVTIRWGGMLVTVLVVQAIHNYLPIVNFISGDEMSLSLVVVILNFDVQLMVSFLRTTLQELEVGINTFESGSKSLFEVMSLFKVDFFHVDIVRKIYLIKWIHWLVYVSLASILLSVWFVLALITAPSIIWLSATSIFTNFSIDKVRTRFVLCLILHQQRFGWL